MHSLSTTIALNRQAEAKAAKEGRRPYQVSEVDVLDWAAASNQTQGEPDFSVFPVLTREEREGWLDHNGLTPSSAKHIPIAAVLDDPATYLSAGDYVARRDHYLWVYPKP